MEILGEFPSHHERVVIWNVEGGLGITGGPIFLMEFIEWKKAELALSVTSLERKNENEFKLRSTHANLLHFIPYMQLQGSAHCMDTYILYSM